MKLMTLAPLALMLLAACDGNPFVPDDGSGGGGGGGGGGVTPNPVTPTIPAATGRNLETSSFNPGDATITVRLRSQDAAALDAVYNIDPTFNVGDYTAYTYQETTSNRFVVALVREVGDVKGGIVVDGGQFANYFGGGTYMRADVFTRPTGAAALGNDANYSGTYVGLWNYGPAAPGGPGGGLNPERSYRIEGRALVTADFTDMSMSGGVDNRRIIDAESLTDPFLESLVEDGEVVLPTLALRATTIAADGSFIDRVIIGTQEKGDFSGIFGPRAEEVAALLVFNPLSDQNLFEHGLIVLPNCTTGGGPACPAP